MKERAIQPQTFFGQLDVSLVYLSHLANGKLADINNKASLVINSYTRGAKFIFPNEADAAKTVVELVQDTLDTYWDIRSTKNIKAKEQQLLDNILLLKRQGMRKEEIVERLNLHFRWGLNSQKI